MSAGAPAAASVPEGAPAAEPRPVVVYLVRHAEKVADGSRDPELTGHGRHRARTLAAVLADAGVTHLLSTPFRRTRQTLEPLAGVTGLAVETLETAAVDDWLDRLSSLPPGAVAVVAGHSNTIPALVRGLAPGAAAAPDGDLPEDAHDRLFVVVTGASQDAAPVALALRYPPLER